MIFFISEIREPVPACVMSKLSLPTKLTTRLDLHMTLCLLINLSQKFLIYIYVYLLKPFILSFFYLLVLKSTKILAHIIYFLIFITNILRTPVRYFIQNLLVCIFSHHFSLSSG